MTFVLLQVITVCWLLVLVAASPRTVEPWAWAVVAWLTRAALAPPHVLMSWEYPYQVFLTYTGELPTNPLYGSGWAAFVSVLRPFVGASPDRVNQIHMVLSALVPALVWSIAERATGDRATARFGALLATLLPLPIAVGATETPLILCATLLATALLGLSRADRLGASLAAMSAALLAHIRPDQLGVVSVVVVGLLAQRAWGPALAVVGVVALRVAELLGPGAIPLPTGELRGIPSVVDALYGRGSTTTLLDPWVTPFWVAPLMLWGLWFAWRTPRLWTLGAVSLLALLAGTLPYVGLHRVTDLARFHLPPQVAACVLAALAWPGISKRGAAARVVLLPLLALGVFVARQPLGPPLVHDVDDARMRALMPTLPAGSTVRYDPSRDGHGVLKRYVEVRFGVTWVAWGDDAPLAPGELVWRGVADRWDTARPTPRCTLQPIDIVHTPPWDGGLINLGPEPVRIGLERVVSCP